MAEPKFPVMYHSRLWNFAPKILYNQSDLDNFLAVATLDDWVKSPDPPIDPAEKTKYTPYPKTLYSVNIHSQVVENANQEALMSSTYHPLEFSPAEIEAAQQALKIKEEKGKERAKAEEEIIQRQEKAQQAQKEHDEKEKQQQPKNAPNAGPNKK